MSYKLTYGDFSRTGYQDCSNVFDVSDHYEAWRRLGKPHGVGIAAKVVREAWGDDESQYASWLEQADVNEIVDNNLEPRAAYKAWRAAWQNCAESAVKAYIKEWIKQEE